MKTYRLIVVTVLVLLLGLPPTAVSAQASAAISFTFPTPNTFNVGDEVSFDLIITVNNVDPGVSGADIYVKYDPEVVRVPASPNSVAEARPDFFGASNFSVNEVTQCPDGTLSCIHLVVAGPAQATHSGAVARFHFVGKARGTTCFSVVKSTLANANGFPVSHSTPKEQCVTVESPSEVTGTALRQGSPAYPNPGMGTLACSSVTATNGSKSFGPLNTDVNGKFKFGKLPNGTYAFRVTYPGYLASEKIGVIVNQKHVDLGATTLRGGDVNGDNAVNILDIGAVISKFGKTGAAVKSASADCSGADEPADINDDGQVNIGDLAIVAGNWLKTGPTLWQ